MRGRIGVNQILDENDGLSKVLGVSIKIKELINATPPEGLWLLADRGLAIGQKTNGNSVDSACPVR
jgi:hypothetical protein